MSHLIGTFSKQDERKCVLYLKHVVSRQCFQFLQCNNLFKMDKKIPSIMQGEFPNCKLVFCFWRNQFHNSAKIIIIMCLHFTDSHIATANGSLYTVKQHTEDQGHLGISIGNSSQHCS